jgi:hypothetical protein
MNDHATGHANVQFRHVAFLTQAIVSKQVDSRFRLAGKLKDIIDRAGTTSTT